MTIFLQTQYANTNYLSVFKPVSSNKEAFLYLNQIIKNNGWNLYIKNCSFLGYSTYRVFISNITSSRFRFEDYAKSALIKQKIRDLFSSDQINERSLLELISELNKTLTAGTSITLNEILHVKKKNDIYSTFILEVVLLLREGRGDEAFNIYRKSFKGMKNGEYIELYLYTLTYNPKEIDLIEKFIQNNSNNYAYINFKHFVDLYKSSSIINKCRECDTCIDSERCISDRLFTEYAKIELYKDKFDTCLEDYKEDF